MERITLHTQNTTYQIGINEKGFLLHLYYGPRTDGDMSNLMTYCFRCGHGNPYDYGIDRTFSCDFSPQEYSCYGSGDYRNHAIRVRDAQGVAGADLRYKSHRFVDGKYTIPGLPASYGDAKTCEITLEDPRLNLEVVLKYGVFYAEDIITRCVEVKNNGTDDLYLNKVMSASFDFVTGQYDLIHFYGRHFNEMNFERTFVGHEAISIGSRRGVSGHQHNPFAILCDRDAGEEFGSCYGMSLMYSGNYVIQAEQDQYSQTRFQAGISDEMLDYLLPGGERFHAPEVIMTYSAEGLGKLSRNYHRFIRNNVCRGKYQHKRRPILVNNWEATYFDFTGDKLLEISAEAAKLGIEMFVLDDGWFGNRGCLDCEPVDGNIGDDRGLGDWFVNEEKMGGPISNIVEKVNAMGLKFGLWIEPEMVNENSRLYQAHPDWALQIPGKKPVLGRNQLVLDYTRDEVIDGIFDQITKVVDSANIEYIKMDMNRSICEAYSAAAGHQNFGEITYKYVLGVYKFLDKLLARYPDLLIEGCSSGGARYDAGMMYYTPQIWTSDNSDAIERLNIQCSASYGYPVSVVGSHVSAVPNHQNGRITDIDTRGMVAMSGNFGYELDLTKLSQEEKDKIKAQIVRFKADWDIIHNGDYYRVTPGGENREFVAWNMVSQDRKQALLNLVTTNTHGNPLVIYGKCKGLDKDTLYRCRETGEVFSGAVLMHIGMPMPMVFAEYVAFQYHFDAI